MCCIKKLFLKISRKNFNIYRKTPGVYCWSLFLIKLQPWRPVTFLTRDPNTGVFLWILKNFLVTAFLKKNICERLYLTDFSEQLVFREGVFQNSLTNIFISNFYWTLDVSQTASYEIILVRLLVFPSVCLSILLSISAILYKMMADHDM